MGETKQNIDREKTKQNTDREKTKQIKISKIRGNDIV